MSIRDMRIGDTIIGADARTYKVEVKSFDKVKARENWRRQVRADDSSYDRSAQPVLGTTSAGERVG